MDLAMRGEKIFPRWHRTCLWRGMTSILRLLCVVVVGLVGINKSLAANVVLSWTPGSSSAVAGYHVYFGTTAGNYPYKLDAGNATSLTISNLAVGGTNFFAVTAYDAAGHESAMSAPLQYAVPFTLKLRASTATSSRVPIQFEAAPMHWYEVQASADLKVWNSVWHSALVNVYSTLSFTDYPGGVPARYYRLVVH